MPIMEGYVVESRIRSIHTNKNVKFISVAAPNMEAVEVFLLLLYYLISCINPFQSICIPMNPNVTPQTQAEPIQGNRVMC